MPVTKASLTIDLTSEEMRRVIRKLGRHPNTVEWGMFDIMWSEHCSYKSSRPVLKLLPTKSPRVIVGPGQDAGVVDIGDGYAVVFKIESHNHPSAIEPYNGAATGIGGIIRDILCMGARPIALLDSLRFGSMKSGHSRWLFQYVVKGIADYGNCCGIPTVAGDVEFDDSFETNCLVNVVCVGTAKHEDVTPSEMRRPGDWLVLVGGSTGRDGIHGVTFASKALTEKSEEDRPAVQIGDPFLKKVVIEATLEVIRTGYVRGLKDLGGGGLTCASSEMAARGGVGAELWLEKLRLREDGMDPFEIMLSESQERMLFVVNPKGLDKVLKTFDKYDLPYSVIGKVTSTGELVIKRNGKIVAHMKPEFLADAPVIFRKGKKPTYIIKLKKMPKPPMPRNLTDTLYSLLAAPNIASKEWVYRQYDHEVGVRTILKPGDSDAAVLRVLEVPNKAIAMKADCNSRHCYLDPYNGHAGAVAEAVRNVVAVGAEPIAMVNGCNFGNPEKPDVFWQFREAVRGMADMCKALGIPCVGGNVSFYNEDERTGKAVKPTAIVVMVGLIENLDRVTTLSLKEVNDVIIALGKTYPELGGSEYYCEIHKVEGGKAPKADPKREKASINTVLQSIRAGYVTAAHDCSKGGIAVALALMAIKGGLGVEVDLEKMPANKMRLDELLFSESYARFIVTARREDANQILQLAKKNGTPASEIGTVTTGDQFLLTSRRNPIINCSVKKMGEFWSQTIPVMMGACQ
jgi:phosphoribosylformylglycinamidine synthase